jgi:hypothetical protein
MRRAFVPRFDVNAHRHPGLLSGDESFIAPACFTASKYSYALVSFTCLQILGYQSRMQRWNISITTLSVVLALGGAVMTQVAPILFPTHPQVIFGIGAVLFLIGLGGLVWAFALAGRSSDDVIEQSKSVADRKPSVTFDIADSDDIMVEDTFSTADNLFHVKGIKGLSARRQRHSPD